jgi:hypothetical protein
MTTNESEKTKRIPELIANITARRDYINTCGGLSVAEVNRHERQIRAWERELEDLGGEMLKDEPRHAACGASLTPRRTSTGSRPTSSGGSGARSRPGRTPCIRTTSTSTSTSSPPSACTPGPPAS